MAVSKKTSGKKTSGGNTKGKGASKPANVPPSGGNGAGTPYFVLTILVLITVFLIMFNNFRDGKKFLTGTFKGREVASDSSKSSKITKKKEDKVLKKESSQSVKNQKDDSRDPEDVVAEKREETRVFFLKLNEKTEHLYLASVKRTVPVQGNMQSAIDFLIKGPSKYEKSRGFFSAVPKSLRLISAKVNGKNAILNFSGHLEKGAAGEILLKRVRQIVYTATEFKNIDSITLLINGKKRKTLGVDGLFIGRHLKR